MYHTVVFSLYVMLFFYASFLLISYTIEIFFKQTQSCRTTLGDKEVTVAVTPNGYADGLAFKDDTEYFVMPAEEQMLMRDFIDQLDDNE